MTPATFKPMNTIDSVSEGYMRAAVRLPTAKRPMVQMVKKPVVLPNTVLLEVAAAGICESDCRLSLRDDRDPFIMGHEIVGHAREIGDGVKDIKLGALYAVWELIPCSKAVGANPFFLKHGLGIDGGFARFVLINMSRATLVRVPDSLANKPELAALAVDSTALVYHAVHEIAKLRPYKGKEQSGSPKEAPRVLVCGIKGIGHQAMWLAKSYGATTFACDPFPHAQRLASSIGVKHVFNFAEITLAVLKNKQRFDIDIVIDFIGSEASLKVCQLVLKQSADKSTVDAGTLVLVRPRSVFNGRVYDQLSKYNTHTVLACRAVEDLQGAFRLLADGVIQPTLQCVSLEDIGRVLDELEQGEVLGHPIVTSFEATKASSGFKWKSHPLE